MAVEHAGPRCGLCRHWDQWVGDLGDCLEYVRRRQAALSTYTGADVAEVWPLVAAPTTTNIDSCSKFEVAP